jgi:hypothetical protein
MTTTLSSTVKKIERSNNGKKKTKTGKTTTMFCSLNLMNLHIFYLLGLDKCKSKHRSLDDFFVLKALSKFSWFNFSKIVLLYKFYSLEWN